MSKASYITARGKPKDGTKKYTTEVNVTDIKGLVTEPVDAQPAQREGARPPQGRPAQRQAAPSNDRRLLQPQ